MVRKVGAVGADFQSNLRAALAADPTQNGRIRARLARIDRMPPARQAMAWDRIERRVRREAGMKTSGAIDWSTLDWSTILKTIVDILIKILPLILAFL